MFLDEFHSVVDGCVRITPEQASRFAKEIADDYNPLHDPGARRFCTPGDLLFALVLRYYGLSQRMTFTFRGMVGGDVPLCFPHTDAETFDITDASGKVYLQVDRFGERTRDLDVIAAVSRHYVAFSGQNFPQVLQPLLSRHRVMFNPDRPLVIYDSMGFTLDRLEVPDARMVLTGSNLCVTGKRGDVLLHFNLYCDGVPVGTGSKKLVLSGLRAYDEDRMQSFIDAFRQRRAQYGLNG